MQIFYSFEIALDLAPFNEKRTKIIRNAFSALADPNTPIGPVNPQNGMLMLRVEQTNETVVVAPKSILYSIESPNVVVKGERFITPVKTIIEELLLESSMKIQMTARWLHDSVGKDTYGASIQNINKAHSGAIDAVGMKLQGIGNRYLINDSGAICELKVEPFLSDSTKWFLETIVHRTAERTDEIESLVNDANRVYSKLVAQLSESLA